MADMTSKLKNFAPVVMKSTLLIYHSIVIISVCSVCLNYVKEKAEDFPRINIFSLYCNMATPLHNNPCPMGGEI